MKICKQKDTSLKSKQMEKDSRDYRSFNHMMVPQVNSSLFALLVFFSLVSISLSLFLLGSSLVPESSVFIIYNYLLRVYSRFVKEFEDGSTSA